MFLNIDILDVANVAMIPSWEQKVIAYDAIQPEWANAQADQCLYC